MGDRANIVVQYGDGQRIFLYSHWSGTEMPEILRQGLLRGKPRWSDESYLARILFCEMVQGSVLDVTGYGIAPYPCDNDYPLLLVDPKKQQVRVTPYHHDKWGKDDAFDWDNPYVTFTFEEFVSLESADWKSCCDPDALDSNE